MSYSLYLTDIIEKTGLPKEDIAVVRHTLSDENVLRVWRAGIDFFEEYQRIQPADYFSKKKYIFSFINQQNTTARFIGVYEVVNIKPIKDATPMQDYPLYGDYEQDELVYYELKKMDILADFQKRLVIDWGSGTRKIVQHKWDTLSKKPVLSIDDQPEDVFPGYEKLVWSYSEMSRFVNNPIRYPEVYKALAGVNGVYLVLDPIDNKQYVGSAYGAEGIFGRWKTYAITEGKGGSDEGGANKKLAAHLNAHKGRYLELQYSILAVLHRTGNEDKDKKETIEIETLYKEKLGSKNKETGLNLN